MVTCGNTEARSVLEPVRSALRMILALMAAGLLSACASDKRGASNGLLPAEAKEIYDRSSVQFEQARFFKPLEERGEEEELTFKLAPLVLQETEAGEAQRVFAGELALKGGGAELDVSKPTVYVHTDMLEWKGASHPRLTYLWFFKAGRSKTDEVRAQGVRITLNGSGEPVIWEGLRDSSGAQLVFVSRSVESAAAAEYGEALAGRRHAVEGQLGQASNLIVARVIEDGPVAMGPIVYLRGGDADIATVICRCMPAQVKNVAGAPVNYRLEPWNGRLFARPAEAPFWPGAADNRIGTGLRLPTKF